MSAEVRLDWASAEVRDAKLVVALRGKQTRDWRDAFERTVHLLGHGDWEKVKLKKGEVRVKRVTPGDEDRLCHFLESAVLQANSATAPQGAKAGKGDAERRRRTDDRESSADEKLTKRIRSFSSR